MINGGFHYYPFLLNISLVVIIQFFLQEGVLFLFIWKEEFETGNVVVDGQHKKLFNIGNEAYELLKKDFCLDKYDQVVKIINQLRDYTAYHFQEEEEYMLKIGYKGFFAHKVEHDDFIEKINHIDYSLIDQGQDEYILEILNFIAEWITEHILKSDMQHSLSRN